jgi:hypothetical protein
VRSSLREQGLNAAIFTFGYFIPRISPSRNTSGSAGSSVPSLPWMLPSCGPRGPQGWRNTMAGSAGDSFLRCARLESAKRLARNGAGAA